MIPRTNSSITLKDWIFQEFLPNLIHNYPFIVIYDFPMLLYSIIKELKNNIHIYDDLKILEIEAKKEPTEYLQRLEIADDFLEEKGWYEHKWIIYIYGHNTNEIEVFNSFLYYENLGTSIKFSSLMEFLSGTKLGLIEKFQEIDILSTNPEIQLTIFSSLLNVPVKCWRDEEGIFLEAGFWLSFLYSNILNNEDYEEVPSLYEQSPIIQTLINKSLPPQITDTILELIFQFDNESFELSENREILVKLYDSIFSYIARELKYNGFIVREKDKLNVEKTFLKLISHINHYGRDLQKEGKKIIQKQKGLFDSIKDSKYPPISAISKFQVLLKEWVNQSNTDFREKFVIWMKNLRDEVEIASISLKDSKQFLNLSNRFDSTGLLDILMIIFLSKSKLKDIDIEEIVKNREKIWKNNASKWWNDYKIFKSDNIAVSMEEIWNLAKIIINYKDLEINNSENWENVIELAWNLQLALNDLSNPLILKVITNLSEMSEIKDYYNKTHNNLNNQIDKLNKLFQNYYEGQIDNILSKESNLIEAKKIFSEIKNIVSNNETVALIFCDGLRFDLLMNINKKLGKIKSKYNTIIENYSKVIIPTYILPPSTTAMGWTSILADDNPLKLELDIKGSNIEDIKIKIENLDDPNLSKLLANNDLREERIASILSQGNNNIKIHIKRIDPTQYDSQITEIGREITETIVSNSESNISIIPVIWYDKIDNHDIKKNEFFRNYSEYINAILEMIVKFHQTNIKNVYILVDHGFIFSDNGKHLEKIPVGRIYHRFAITKNSFDESQKDNYKDWMIFNIDPKKKDYLSSCFHSDYQFSLVFPKGYSLFRKTAGNEKYIHGGISFQECYIGFLKSHCDLYKTVGVQDIIVKDEELGYDMDGKEAYLLRSESDGKYFIELKVIATNTNKDEQLKPIDILMKSDDTRIQITPNKKSKLVKNKSRIYKIFFKNNNVVNKFIIYVVDQMNRKLSSKEFNVTTPSPIPDLF